jgi:NAD(P)-dependent dehydrogenase (short-subunit alcohol dehydrogenase family)
MSLLDGKVAIVTGSGRGIGREVALRLARDGAHVVVNDLDDEPARETIALVEKLGGRAVACNGNVTAPDFGERIVDTAAKQFGGLHIVVNNAGYTWDNVIQKMTDEQWYTILDVHLTAPFRILRAFANYLRPAVEAERNAGKRIVRKVVNVSSTSGTNGNAGQVNYSAGKAAITGRDQDARQGMGALRCDRELRGVRLHPDAAHAAARRGRVRDHRGRRTQGARGRAGRSHRGHEPDDPARARWDAGGGGGRHLPLLHSR